jgi:hypothetical protein
LKAENEGRHSCHDASRIDNEVFVCPYVKILKSLSALSFSEPGALSLKLRRAKGLSI